MQIIQHCGGVIRRAAVFVPFFISSTAVAQDSLLEIPADSGRISTLQIGLICGVIGLLLLLALSIFLLLKYRRQFLSFSQKCEDLLPELDHTNQELTQMTNRFADTLESHSRMLDECGAAVFKLNDAGECIYINQAMEALCGRSKQQILESGLISAVHPEDRERVGEEWRSFVSVELPYQSGYRLQRQDRSIVYVAERGSVIRDKDQSVLGYFGLLVDVSAQELRCQQAHASEQRSEFMCRTVGSFYELRPDEPIVMDQPAEKVADRIHRQMKLVTCNRGLAEFCGRSVEELTGTALKDLPGGCGLFENPDDIQKFLEGGLSVQDEERVCSNHRGTPLYLHNDAWGIVEDGKLVCIMGAQYDISEQKRDKEQFDQQLAFFQRILNTLPGDVFIKDSRCRYQYVSRGFEERTGVPVADWMDKTIFEVLPAVSRDANEIGIQAMKNGELCRKVDSKPGSDGTEWVETIENPLLSDDGVVEGVVGITIDVTDRTRREQELQQSESCFRGLVENNPFGMMMADASSKRISYANPAFCDLFGYTADEIPRLTVGDLHSPGSRRQVLAEWAVRAENSQRFDNALSCVRKDRSVVFTDLGVTTGSFGGSERMIGIYSDAAPRKAVEAELEKQRDLQAGILRNASMLVATVDPSGVVRSANDALLELLGMDESAVVGHSYVKTLVCKDDRDLLKNAFSENASERKKDYEYRLATAGGTFLTVNCRIQEREDVYGFTVTGMDVTRQRTLEQQLSAECDELRNRIAERESQVTAARTAREESRQLCDKLIADLEKMEETLAGKVKHFENDLEAYRLREETLNKTVSELETQREALEETLEARLEELQQESGQREQLDTLLQQTREEFAAERMRFESETGQKIAGLTEELEARRAREEELTAECAKLNSSLAEIKKSLQERSMELESSSSEWKAREHELLKVRGELEERVEEQRQQIEKAASERTALESELKALRKEAAAGRETYQVRIEQQTAPLKQEVNRLKERAQELEAAQEENNRHLEELNSALEERTAELEAAVAAHKEQEQSLQETRRQMEEELKNLQEKLGRESEQSGQLDELLKKTRDEFAEERGRIEAEFTQTIDGLKSELQARTAHEDELTAECERLGKNLAEVSLTLEDRSGELESRISEWRSREDELLQVRSDLEERIAQQVKELEQSASERSSLERELEELRKEAAAGRETYQVQIEQKTVALANELNELREREKQLKAAQTESSHQLAELESSLAERTAELDAAVAARKQQEQALLETRRRMEEAVVQEKNRLAEQVKQFNDVKAASRDTEKTLRRTEAELQQRVEELEVIVEQRTRELANAADQRIDLENQIAETREAAAQERDAVEEQIQQRTRELKEKLKRQHEHEDQIKAEQAELSAQLIQTQETLEKRTAEVSSLQKAKEELEGMVKLEKDGLAHRISLFKEEMQENRRAQQSLQEREEELQSEIDSIRHKLSRQERMTVQEADARRIVTQEAERLRKTIEASGRKVYDFAEDLTAPLEPVVQLSAAVLDDDDDLPSGLRTRLKKINRCGQRLQSMLNYQQELFQLENGGIHLQPEPFVLNTFLTGLTDEFTEKAKERRLFFALSRSSSLPPTVCIDPAGIRQVLDSLFDHALEKTDGKGRVGLHVTCENLDEHHKKMEFLLVYSSLDQDAAVTGGLFDSNSEEKPTREMNEEELRLSLTRRYAELLGGTLCLQEPSELTKRLSFSLPVEFREESETAPEDLAAENGQEKLEEVHA
ncbi:PAS domain S-box protein [Tichowtungia aerotolerans]|uniref:histidine kinase n=1 Tax=Tichowtungia aerotolerans TaxID=2697043 RepID=A0A6P1MFE5_9BACT|nr:PAS domain S-box protein [Tichowtungia aerotolerans]QHI70728.1 PAS domain S-box protein [Tichowtungia aerotolerans]